jgi:hypothetical protein
MGLLFGRLQRYVGDVKADISREMELDELRKLQKQVQGAAQEFKSSVESAAQNVHAEVRGVEDQLNATAAEATSGEPATNLPLDCSLPSERIRMRLQGATSAADAGRLGSRHCPDSTRSSGNPDGRSNSRLA